MMGGSATFGVVTAVCSSPTHTMSKPVQPMIRLVAGYGVEGDAHAGAKVKHRSRVGKGPVDPPNLRQVHLIHAELHEELAASGYVVSPGVMGENITTHGIDLLGLPVGTRLNLGHAAVVELSGLRNPCTQLDGIQKGLMKAVLDHDANGDLVRKAGVMSVVLESGDVRAGDTVRVELPPEPHVPLRPV
jgi:MOSC domain-containing protein YiiM